MKSLKLFLFGLIIVSLTACGDDDPSGPDNDYEIPLTYDFENVDYSGQTTRIQMLTEMKKYIDDAVANETQIRTNVLLGMFKNEGDHFSNPDLNLSDKDIYSKTIDNRRTYFEGLIAEMNDVSTTAPASNGTEGILTSEDGTRKYLVDEDGREFAQMIEKELMGACFFYQASEVYLREGKIGDEVDNTTVEEGVGTPMQHHWDEAFGYLGVNNDFPNNTEDVTVQGKYLVSRDAVIEGLAENIMLEGFSKGRAAINNNDMEAKWEAAEAARDYWELSIAATAINYLNQAKDNFTDDAIRCHVLSEAYAFTSSLQYNTTSKRITLQQISNVLESIGSNFYDTTLAGINNAIDILAQNYGLESVKDAL